MKSGDIQPDVAGLGMGTGLPRILKRVAGQGVYF